MNQNNKTKILIVDDEMNNLNLLISILRKEKYNLSFATTGSQALELLKEQKYCLVLLDVNLPDIDGFELCKNFRKFNEYTPVLFITGLIDNESKINGFKVGAQDYITKPFCEEELLARIKTHIELYTHRVYLESIIEEKTSELNKLVDKLKKENAKRKTAEKETNNKNIALTEILNFLEKEKNDFKNEIITNCNQSIIPFLNKIRTRCNDEEVRELDEILNNFSNIIEELPENFLKLKQILTHTEFQVCELTRDGYRIKEIADKLSLSESTIKWHKANISKKINLPETENLYSYLVKL